jgi:hypothetical protein
MVIFSMERKIQIPEGIDAKDFDVQHIGKRIYELTLKTPITASGGAVNHDYVITEKHRLVRVEVKHTTSANVDSADAFTWALSKQIKGLFQKLVSYTASVASDFIELFGEGYEFSSTTYRLTENTTNTDRIYLKLVVQLLD